MPTTIPALADITIFEERFAVREAESDSRLMVSERPTFTRGRFNTLLNPVTREVTIAAPRLIFAGRSMVLGAIKKTRDVTRVVLIADEVRIEEPLHWMGAEVEIVARRLVFRGDGQIVTTPEQYPATPFTQTRDEHGNPLGPDGAIHAADGQDGEAGGDVTLAVAELDVGDGQVIRFVTDGGQGELGERGGVRPFVPRKNGPPTQNLEPVTFDTIEEIFKDAGNSTGDLTDLQHWQFRGGRGEDALKRLWAELTGDAIRRGEYEEHSDHVVTDARVGLGFQRFLQLVYHEVRRPIRPGSPEQRNVPNAARMQELWEETRTLANPWTPSDGPDAYPSGVTGRGGDAGTVRLPTGVRPAGRWASQSGGASPLSEHVRGGEPGTPQAYRCIAFTAMQFAPGVLNPGANLIPVMDTVDATTVRGSTSPGADAEGRARGPGDDGALASVDDRAWLDPRLLRIVADYARELYAAGQRERAWEVVAPYWRVTRERSGALEPDARASLQAIDSLVLNYQQNLDLYGNPPGWVPRFSATSYFRTFLADRRFSYRFVGVMERAVKLMTDLEQGSAMLSDLATTAEGTLDQIHGDLFAAFKGYDGARDRLDEARRRFVQAQHMLDALESEAEIRALVTAQDQAIVNAVFKVSGAILKAIPVYQPALAGIGAVVEGVGELVVEGIGSSEPVDGWRVLESVGTSVASTLEDNAGTFKSQLEGELRTRYRDQLDPDAADLRSEVARLRTSIAEGQASHDEAVVEAHNAVAANAALADLLSADAEIADRLAAQAEDREQLLSELARHNDALADLERPVGGVAADAAERARQRLLIGRAKLYTLLANNQNARRRLEVEQRDKSNDRAAIQARIDAQEARRTALDEQQAALDALLPEFEKQEANERIKEANKTAGKVLDGVQRLAKGAATIATSIRAAATPPERESEAVQALRTRILETSFAKQYVGIQEEVAAASEVFSRAMTELAAHSQAVTTLAADFAATLQTTIDIGRNRLAFTRGVDPALKTSLVAMQQQARQRMDYYLYLFRKAYMYEYCTPTAPVEASLNTFLSSLDEWLEASRAAVAEGRRANGALADIATLSAMASDDLGQLGDDVMRNNLSEVARTLLVRRHADGRPRSNKFRFSVPKPHRTMLASDRRAELGPALDLIADPVDRRAFFSGNRLLRIMKISIENGDFRFRSANRPKPPLSLEIEVGREFVLWDGRQHVLFRIGRSEEPLKFGFVANRFDAGSDGEWIANMRAEDRGGGPDDLFTAVMREATKESLTYTEINPSFLSTLTLALTIGGRQVDAITKLKLTIDWQSG